MAKIQRMIRPSDMRQWTGLSRTVVDDLVRAGKFPKPIKLTDGGRAVAWLEEDVAGWQQKVKAERDAREAERA